jgi:hypothetical protein
MKTSSVRKSLWMVLAAGVSLGLYGVGCGDDTGGHDHGDDDHHHDEEIGTPTGAECPDGGTLTYESFGQEFMASYCTNCHSAELEGSARHGAPADHDFDTLDGIQSVADHIDQYAAAGPDSTNTTMPPTDPKPSMAEREMLGEWLACGAPE